MSVSPSRLPTPDFYDYPWTPLESAAIDDDFVALSWPDGLGVRAHGWWLRENVVAEGATDLGTVLIVSDRVGPARDTNFGPVWSVKAQIRGNDENSTANTMMRLGPHTDLPTRETPPGFQFLHCIENSCQGGWSRLTDGAAVVAHLQHHEPETYEALSTLPWVFFNRSRDHDHRWSGPMIDHGAPGSPLTIRAFYPVRAFPDMADADVPRAYRAAKRFHQLGADARFQISYPFRPGDLIAFDNRRILHGRDAFDKSAGERHLRGCYLDQDDVHSRLRVLARRRGQRPTTPNPNEQL